MPRIRVTVLVKSDMYPFYIYGERYEWEDDEFEDKIWCKPKEKEKEDVEKNHSKQ